jgi:tRNA modification GTPase
MLKQRQDMTDNHDTICAIATANGNGAIAVIRMSGDKSFDICKKIFNPVKSDKDLDTVKGNTLVFGTIHDNNEIIDEVLVSVFRTPHSYTGENSIEISCHGSTYIQQKILQLLIENGARMARPGEYTQRAFLNGKLDLSQAEAVADLIASSSKAAHKLAMNQVRGGFSKEINSLRMELLNFISLVELELDFSEEDVEFADRSQLVALVEKITKVVVRLRDSFKLGNAIKNGIPVTIAGDTNVGKSTLLNALLNEDRAIVSDIEGTTRDVIEDTVNIEGVTFRFIDTAGIRTTRDKIESLGIERTYSKIDQANVVLLLLDTSRDLEASVESLSNIRKRIDQQQLIIIANKIDKATDEQLEAFNKAIVANSGEHLIHIAAKSSHNIDTLNKVLLKTCDNTTADNNQVIVTNARHYEILCHAYESLERVTEGLNSNISGDFLAQDIRMCIHHLGEITGTISADDVLGHIFKNFCIGK